MAATDRPGKNKDNTGDMEVTVDFYDHAGQFICSREMLFVPQVGTKVMLKHPNRDIYFEGAIYEIDLDLRNNPVYSVYVVGKWE